MVRSRQRGQSVIEFGIIAILFTLIMFAIADFGLLLNNWITVSSAARVLARDAAVGMFETELEGQATALKIPGVSADAFPGGFCCGPTAALSVTVTYYDQCTPGVGTCNTVPLAQLDDRYYSNGQRGGCHAPPPPAPACAHPSPPKAGSCNGNPTCPGDSVVVTMVANGAQVITPLVRPFFTKPGVCPDSSSPSHCYVALFSSVTMRFEGDTL